MTNIMTNRRVYLTGLTPSAVMHRLRMWRAYRRPVTYLSLRRAAYDAAYRAGDLRNPDPVALALFDALCREAEKPVWDAEDRA